MHQIPQWADDLQQALNHLHDHFRRLDKKVDQIMAVIDDILAKQDQALAKATANTDALSAIKTILDANTATIQDLKAQLDAAGANPAKLQALSDNMDKILAAADNQATAEATLANTPAAPPAPTP
jgi:chromosome segregation ATPase